MKHSISIIPDSSIRPIERCLEEETHEIDFRERIPEVDADGTPYHLLIIYTDVEISEETELAVDRLPSVIASTFNIEE